MAKYLSDRERCIIETMLKDGFTQRQIADRLGRHYNTINYEIKKGRVKLLNSDLTTRVEYCCDTGQRIHEERQKEKGRPLKIANDMDFVHFVEHKILHDKYSPYATLVRAKGNFKTDICLTTLYSYIDKGIFLNVTNKDLPVKPKKKRKQKTVKRSSYKNMGAKTIEERPISATDRKEYGHWELDTVVGSKKKDSGCLMVLTERMTLDEIIMKLDAKKASCVVSAFDDLERAYGSESFRQMFKTITPDNGCEFADWENIERDNRTSVFFAHPYAPHERGSNENQNKFIRRFSPKGKSMADLTQEDATNIQEWINNYPRKKFGGLSSAEYKRLVI